MSRKKLTITLAFSEQSPGRRFSLTGVAVAVLGLVSVLLLGAVVTGTWYTYQYFAAQEEWQTSAEQQREWAQALRETSVNARIMREKLLAYEERNSRIETLLGLDQPLAYGGIEAADLYSEVYQIQERELAGRLREDLRRIEAELEKSVEVQSSLNEYMGNREELLSFLPSINPALNSWATSGFGPRHDPFTNEVRMHRGLDLTAFEPVPILAAADGVVVGAGYEGAFGYMITVDHAYGLTTRYAHLSKIYVRVGDRVEKGEEIGRMGRTGRATGMHLHYEVLYEGRPVDPAFFILD
jgi:murein DD-endopeptidase MepM/ murein hydrolase activator NlpD